MASLSRYLPEYQSSLTLASTTSGTSRSIACSMRFTMNVRASSATLAGLSNTSSSWICSSIRTIFPVTRHQVTREIREIMLLSPGSSPSTFSLFLFYLLVRRSLSFSSSLSFNPSLRPQTNRTETSTRQHKERKAFSNDRLRFQIPGMKCKNSRSVVTISITTNRSSRSMSQRPN